jgi:hypothetical protein
MHNIATTCENNRTISAALFLSDTPGILDDPFWKLHDARPPPEAEATNVTEYDYYVGAWVDVRHGVVTPSIFKTQIYFHPSLIQPTSQCVEKFDPDEDEIDTACIPISTIPGLRHNPIVNTSTPYYRLWIDLYRPCFKMEGGSVFKLHQKYEDYVLEISQSDSITVGDWIFVMVSESSTPLFYRVEDDEGLALLDKRTILLEKEGRPLPNEIWIAGWVDSKDDIHDIVSKYMHLGTIYPPLFGGVCGPLQPLHFDSNFIQYILVMSDNVKLIVDHDFFHLWDWAGSDPIQMRLGYFTEDADPDYQISRLNTTRGIDRLEVIYRHVEAEADPNWVTIWKCNIGSFIIEADHPSHCSIYINLYD